MTYHKDTLTTSPVHSGYFPLFTLKCEGTMANELKIRQAQLADAFAISTIGTKAFCQAFINPKNEAEVREYVKTVYQTAAIETDLQRKKDYFVIEDNSEILGFSLLSHDPPYPDCSEKYVKVERLYIEPNRIGQGLGLALMNHAVLYGQNNNFDKIWLD